MINLILIFSYIENVTEVLIKALLLFVNANLDYIMKIYNNK